MGRRDGVIYKRFFSAYISPRLSRAHRKREMWEFGEEDEAELVKMFGVFSSEEFRYRFARDESNPMIEWAFSEKHRRVIEGPNPDA